VIAFERVKAAEPAMLEAVKEALVISMPRRVRALAGRAALLDDWSPHHTVLAATNKYLAKSNKSGTGREATKKRESKALCSGP
jgi:hypothetical protein